MNPLDITTAILGLLYIFLEVRESLWMWLVATIMQALGFVLYYQSGLYADCGMEIYYLIMTLYGFLSWKYGKQFWKRRNDSEIRVEDDSQKRFIAHVPLKSAIIMTALALACWAVIYYILITFTDSTVPLADSFTTAFSIVGIWALAHKYLEQWFIWIAVISSLLPYIIIKEYLSRLLSMPSM